jgi:hypothetical protein
MMRQLLDVVNWTYGRLAMVVPTNPQASSLFGAYVRQHTDDFLTIL